LIPFALLFVLIVPTTIVSIGVGAIYPDGDYPPAAHALVVVNSFAVSLLVIIDPIVIMRDRDVKEQLLKIKEYMCHRNSRRASLHPVLRRSAVGRRNLPTMQTVAMHTTAKRCILTVPTAPTSAMLSAVLTTPTTAMPTTPTTTVPTAPTTAVPTATTAVPTIPPSTPKGGCHPPVAMLCSFVWGVWHYVPLGDVGQHTLPCSK
jgi:hypothetical protein